MVILRNVIYRVLDEFGAVEDALMGPFIISIVLVSPVAVFRHFGVARVDKKGLQSADRLTCVGTRWNPCSAR